MADYLFKVRTSRPLFSMEINISDLALKSKNLAISKLRKSKSGVKYKFLPFRSSAPGEAPRDQLGKSSAPRKALAKSIKVRSLDVQKGGARKFELICDHEVAEMLEYGSDYGQVKARPFLRPAIRETVRKYLNEDISTETFIKVKNKKGY